MTLFNPFKWLAKWKIDAAMSDAESAVEEAASVRQAHEVAMKEFDDKINEIERSSQCRRCG